LKARELCRIKKVGCLGGDDVGGRPLHRNRSLEGPEPSKLFPSMPKLHASPRSPIKTPTPASYRDHALASECRYRSRLLLCCTPSQHPPAGPLRLRPVVPLRTGSLSASGSCHAWYNSITATLPCYLRRNAFASTPQPGGRAAAALHRRRRARRRLCAGSVAGRGWRPHTTAVARDKIAFHHVPDALGLILAQSRPLLCTPDVTRL
jgi:hypothetical protein